MLVYHVDIQAVKQYTSSMEKKQTTMRFTAQDLESIRSIRERYGCISDTAAVRLALQIVARKERGKEKRADARGNSSPA